MATNRNFILAHSFAGDDSTVTCMGGSGYTDPDFPPENVLTDRLSCKWRSVAGSSIYNMALHFDLGSELDLRYVVIMGHNFADFHKAHVLAPGGFWYLELQYSVTGAGTYTHGDITPLSQDTMIIVDMKKAKARYVELVMESNDGHGGQVGPDHFEVGRIVIIADDSYPIPVWHHGGVPALIQPDINFRQDYQWGVREYAEVTKTPTARYAANPKYPRFASVNLQYYDNDARRPFLAAFGLCGTIHPVVIFLFPTILPEFQESSVAPIDWADPTNRYLTSNMSIYGYFADPEQIWKLAVVGRGDATIAVEEAVE